MTEDNGTWKLFWLIEDTEVIMAHSIEEARAYIGIDADEDWGEVAEDRKGWNEEGDEVTLFGLFALKKRTATGPDILWSQYSD